MDDIIKIVKSLQKSDPLIQKMNSMNVFMWSSI